MSNTGRPLGFFFAIVIASSACADDSGNPSQLEPAIDVALRPLMPSFRPDSATAASACVYGGESGQRVAYSDPASETRDRAISFDYDEALAASLDLPTDPADLGLDLASISETDGDGQGIVTSADTIPSSVSADIPAELVGQWYRLGDQLFYPASIVALTASGDEHVLGSVTLLDWFFYAYLAQGPSCPPPLPDGYSP